MVKTLSIALALILLTAAPSAQTLDCSPTRGHFAAYNIYTQPEDLPGRLQMAYGPIVPQGEIWYVLQAGIWSEFIGPYHYTMEVLEPLAEQTNYIEATVGNENNCCWRVAVGTADAASNQSLALARPIIMLPGQKMNARSNGQEAGKKFGLTAVYLAMPEACLASLVFGGPVSVTLSSPVPPDFSAMSAAVAALQAAVSALQLSIPQR